MKKYLNRIAVLIILLGIMYFIVQFYPYIFSRKVIGMIENVDRVPLNVSLMVSADDKNKFNPEMYSFAVAIKDLKTNEIVTASSEDRQWAVAEKGKCAEAKYYPYPPWKLDKAGTYYGARLLKMYDCPTGPSD